MTTGTAPTGSNTPPICAAAERCTRFPTCAHEPTRAWLSIIVPSSTSAPALTYIGGMQTTPAARYAPSLTEEPPGTMRTLSRTLVGRTGYVSLSKKRKEAWALMSESTPILKPTRMPLLTHELTRQRPSASRSAARTSPRLSACLNASKTSRSVESKPPPFAYSASTCSRSDMRRLLQQSQLAQHLSHALPRLLRHGHERQAQVLFDESHQSHRGLHGAGARLDEVHVHQGQPAVVQPARLVPAPRERRVHHLRQRPRRFVRRDRDEPVPAERQQRERHRVVAGEDEEALGPAADNLHDLREVARSLLDGGDVLDLSRQPQRRPGRDVRGGAPRHVVEHDGQPRDRLRHRAEVLVQALLRRLVVVGRDDEHGVGARLLRRARVLDGVRRRVAARARDDPRAVLPCDPDGRSD